MAKGTSEPVAQAKAMMVEDVGISFGRGDVKDDPTAT